MGETNSSRFELNESKMQSTRTPDLLGNSMSCKESLDVFRAGTSNAAAMCGLPDGKMLLEQLQPQKCEMAPKPAEPQVCKAIFKDFGKLHCQLDEKGDIFTINDGKGHHLMKTGNKWSLITDGEKGSKEVTDVHVNKDGSYSYKDAHGKYSYDKDGRLAEAPAGDGHSRKYHYDSQGQLDQIDGRLGHWERQVKDGRVSWVNKTKNIVWQGDFQLNHGTLEFHAANGVQWGFTEQGKDIRLK